MTAIPLPDEGTWTGRPLAEVVTAAVLTLEPGFNARNIEEAILVNEFQTLVQQRDKARTKAKVMEDDVGHLASAIEQHFDEHGLAREIAADDGDPWTYMPDQSWKASQELWAALGPEYETRQTKVTPLTPTAHGETRSGDIDSPHVVVEDLSGIQRDLLQRQQEGEN